MKQRADRLKAGPFQPVQSAQLEAPAGTFGARQAQRELYETRLEQERMGRIGMSIVVRVLGLILCALAVQFVLVGCTGWQPCAASDMHCSWVRLVAATQI